MVLVVGGTAVTSSHLVVPDLVVAVLTTTMTEEAHLEGEEEAEAELTAATFSLLEAMAVALEVLQRHLQQNVSLSPVCSSACCLSLDVSFLLVQALIAVCGYCMAFPEMLHICWQCCKYARLLPGTIMAFSCHQYGALILACCVADSSPFTQDRF